MTSCRLITFLLGQGKKAMAEIIANKVDDQKLEKKCVFEECNTNHKLVLVDGMIRFFPFPVENKVKLKEWCDCLDLHITDILELPEVAYICSLHFAVGDVQKELRIVDGEHNLHVTLHADAFPTPVCYYQEDKKCESFDTSDILQSGEPSRLGMTSTPNRATEEIAGTSQQARTVDKVLNGLTKLMAQSDYEQGSKYLHSGEYKLAFKCFKSAANMGLRGALFNLGVMYEKGIGTENNQLLALKCYTRATLLKHKKAMHNLGVFYARGYCGMKKNLTRAELLFKKSGIKQYKRFNRRTN